MKKLFEQKKTGAGLIIKHLLRMNFSGVTSGIGWNVFNINY